MEINFDYIKERCETIRDIIELEKEVKNNGKEL